MSSLIPAQHSLGGTELSSAAEDTAEMKAVLGGGWGTKILGNPSAPKQRAPLQF